MQNVPGEGACVSISDGTRTAANSVKGDAAWQPVKYEFDAPGGEVVLIAELKANKGEVWFDRDSFLVRRVK